MVEAKVILLNPTGLHARPATKFINKAKQFKSKITMQRGTVIADCKSILSVLSANVNQGTEVVLRADGEDEVAAIDAMVDFIENFKE